MKPSLLRLIIGCSFILIVALACTMPFYISSAEPEREIVYIEVTSTPIEKTAAPTSIPIEVGPTPTVSVNIDGEWTIWWGISEDRLKISFLQRGYELVGNTATGDGHSLLFKGTISQDSGSVTGTWESTNGTSGVFLMKLDNSKTGFSGNLGSGVPFCGSRGGSKPSPCFE